MHANISLRWVLVEMVGKRRSVAEMLFGRFGKSQCGVNEREAFCLGGVVKAVEIPATVLSPEQSQIPKCTIQ